MLPVILVTAIIVNIVALFKSLEYKRYAVAIMHAFFVGALVILFIAKQFP